MVASTMVPVVIRTPGPANTDSPYAESLRPGRALPAGDETCTPWSRPAPAPAPIDTREFPSSPPASRTAPLPAPGPTTLRTIAAESTRATSAPTLPRGFRCRPRDSEARSAHTACSTVQPVPFPPERESALGLLGVPLKASHHRQCPLFHTGANLSLSPCGKGELNQGLPNRR